jgi:hypothetical protein
MERRVETVETVVWYKKPMLVPVLGLVALIVVGYFAYEMFKSGHADDGYNSTASESDTTTQKHPVTGTAAPTISSTSGSGNQVTSPTNPSTVEAAADAPASDSQPVQPPEGKAYAGSGHLELYRQGNVTYQYNTDNGANCVMYASLREWRNPLVYRHACR